MKGRGATGRLAGLLRVLRLLQRVQGMRYAPSFDLLAEEFAVSTRTIRRDFELLEDAGFTVPKFRHVDTVSEVPCCAPIARARLERLTMRGARG